MIEFFTEPLSLDFMQQALLIGLLVSTAAAALSCLLVLKGWSLMGDAVSHAVLPGIVIAYIIGIPCLLYTSPSPRDKRQSRMPSSA